MIFNSAKKIQELRDENEKLKAKLAAANIELTKVSKVMEEKDEDEAMEDEEDEVKGEEYKEEPELQDEEEAMEEEEKEVMEDDEEDEAKKAKPSAKVAALIRDHKALQSRVAKLEASISARVSSVLSKMGIDPIHASKGTNDGTKDKPAASSKKGIARAAELLNEKAKR